MQSDSDGLKPGLLEKKDIFLYYTEGRTHSVYEFAKKHIGLLNELEKDIILESAGGLSKSARLKPVVRVESLGGPQKIPAKRCGTRSAYAPSLGIKIKGCRPEEGRFPHWEITENLDVRVGWLPFGVLSAESVMREILAYCFSRKYGLPSGSEPLEVFEYRPHGKFMNYGLASRDNHDARLEEFVDCKGYTVSDVMRKPLKKEVGLDGIGFREYVEKKAELLINFNFNGGFRGILNSNIGNEIVRGHKLYALCDFDSFSVRKVPLSHEEGEIRGFTARAFIELIKASLPFIDYIELGKEEIEALSPYYKENSSVYKAYREKFMEEARNRRWDTSLVEDSIEEALESPVALEILQELVPNNYTFKNFKQASYYVPHR